MIIIIIVVIIIIAVISGITISTSMFIIVNIVMGSIYYCIYCFSFF